MSGHLKHASLLCALGLALAGIGGCGDSCEELEPVCIRCLDVNQQDSCLDSVKEGDQEVCEKNIDDFDTICK